MRSPSTTKRWTAHGRVAAFVTIGAWFLAVGVIGSALLARHLLPMPSSSSSNASLLALRRTEDFGRPFAVHVLYVECRCSQRIADRLTSTARPSGASEHVVVVGDESPATSALGQRLRAAGLAVTTTSAEALAATYGVVSAPLLFVAGSDGSELYRGGYTDRKQGPAPRDREVIEAAIAGRKSPALPVYGCAVAADLKRQRNPLGMP